VVEIGSLAAGDDAGITTTFASMTCGLLRFDAGFSGKSLELIGSRSTTEAATTKATLSPSRSEARAVEIVGEVFRCEPPSVDGLPMVKRGG
jgi:hypothetical protein